MVTCNHPPKKVAAKLFILRAVVATTFFGPHLGGAQSIASRNVGTAGFPDSENAVSQDLA